MNKKFNIINALQKSPTQQHGAVLLVMLVILIMGGTAMLLNSLNSVTPKLARDRITADALAQAKEALIGFAVTYGDAYSGNVHGYLPCPDIDGLPSEGLKESNCGLKNISQIGRLPWKSLNLPPLRDSAGECLWYAVTGAYKYNPKTDLMNWDTNGQLQGYDANGTLQTQSDNQIVAVIFAPGAPLAGQNRSSSATPVCGGNYSAVNYLDNDTLHSINNLDISTGKFIQKHDHRDSNGSVTLTVNDQMLFITKSDIFNAIKNRNNFGTFVASLLSNVATCGLQPVTVDFDTMVETNVAMGGGYRVGRVPNSCFPSPLENWQDNVLYAKCPGGSPCLTLNGLPCRGVLIFSGERSTLQARMSNTQKNTWSNYMEDIPSANLMEFNTKSTSIYSGSTAYSATTPSTDILACIP